MTRLQARAFRDEHRIEQGQGRSYYIVSTPDGEREYEFTCGLSMRSYRNVSGAWDDASRYEFYDDNGVLVIQEAA